MKKIIKQLEEEGWNLVFTDGSAKHHPNIGWVAGFGCTWMGKWETKGHLHPSAVQTNNRAELQAVITVLQHFKSDDIKLVIVTDSRYVYDGLKGSAFRWREAGWVGPSGPVCNVDLWMEPLGLVDTVSPTLRWLRVLSHTNILGNE